MHGGGAGGACVLDAGGALETQIGRSLQHQRGGEILRRKAGVEVAEDDFVDVFRRNRGVGERLGCDPHDQALDRLAGELAERRMRPSHDAGGHNLLLNLFLAELSSLFGLIHTALKHSGIGLCLRARLGIR